MKKGLSLKFKSFIIIVIMSVILCGVAVIVSAFTFSDTNEKDFKEHADDIAHTAAVNIDGDTVRRVTEMVLETFSKVPDDEIVSSDDWGSPEFEAMIERFSWITETSEYLSVLGYLKNIQNSGIQTMSSIYLMVYDSSREEPYALYVVDASEEDPCVPGVIDIFNEDDDFNAIEHPEDGIKPYITYTDTYGWLVVAGAPIYDSNGDYTAFMCVDLSMDEVKLHEYKFIFYLSVLLIIVMFVLSAIYLLIIVKNIVDPIKNLSVIASEYIRDSEKKASFFSVDIRRKDEIGNLTEAMQTMERNINDYIESITKMTAEKERIDTELGVATRIQSDMLPRYFPKREDFSIYAIMDPAKEVGGDFYDFFMTDDDHVVLVMADVSGKGVPAALFMVITKVLIKNRAAMGGTPAEILADVNDSICENNAAGLFVTVWLGILELSTNTLVSANAGHEYPALMRSGGRYELIVNDHCPPLASVEGMKYEDETIKLSEGDRLFLYTDGVTEAKNAEGERYGTGRMIEALNSAESDDPKNLLTHMKEDVDKFIGDNAQFDDITMLGLKFH